jgi:hypothetical protein
MRKTIPTLTLLFLSRLICFGQNPGEQLFSNSKIHEIRITGPSESLSETLTENYVLSFGIGQRQIRKIPYSPALLSIDGTAIGTIGIRHKGFNSWWNSVKKPIKIDLNRYSDLAYDGLVKFNLHNGSGDPSFIRESISYSLLRSLGIPAPRTAYAKVFIDDTYFGLYHLVEQIDNTYLDAHVGNHEGNLYVQESKGAGGFGLDWISDDQQDYYDSLELENHQNDNDWSFLIHFLDVLNHAPENTFRQDIQTVFDVSEYLQILAFDVAINNMDWYGNSGRNYYLAEGNGKFHWLPWDYNLSWREDAQPINIKADEYSVLIQRILKDPQFYEAFLRKYCAILPLFESTSFDGLVDDEVSRIESLMEIDPYLDFPHEAFQTNSATSWDGIPGLKEFAAQRRVEIMETLQSLDVDCSVIAGAQGELESELILYPMPVKDDLYLGVVAGRPEDVIITNCMGQLALRSSVSEQGFIDVSTLPPGCYVLKTIVRNSIYTKLFLIDR